MARPSASSSERLGRPPLPPAGPRVYLDYAGFSPVDPRVVALMRPFMEGGVGNPNAQHSLGLEARARINQLHGRQGEWTAADKRSEQGALHLQTAAQILTGVGATAMVAGATLYLFGSSEKHITHTGMYLGDGKFINATTHETPMVRIDDLNDPYWTRILVAMRRIK